MKAIGFTLALLFLVPSVASAEDLPRDSKLSKLAASFDHVALSNCADKACTKERAAHKRRVRQWRAEMRAALKIGHAGCATLRSKQKGEWKITGFWCEGEVYPKVPNDSESSGEPEWVVLRWKCMKQQCYLTNMRSNGDESRKSGYRVRFKGGKVDSVWYFPSTAVEKEWQTE